jgi:hypothetical protein
MAAERRARKALQLKNASGQDTRSSNLRPGTYWNRLTNAPDRKSALHYTTNAESLLTRTPNSHPSFSAWRLRRLIR